MSQYKLHWISGSPNSWRVLLTLAFKGISYDSKRINPAAWDREGSGFFKLNPRGKVPVIEDGDTVIYESIAIMTYLEAKHPENPIFGKNTDQSGLIWQRIAELIHYTIEPVYELSRLLMRETALDNIDHSKQLVQTISEELVNVNAQLANAPYIAGNELSAADIYFYPAIAFLEKMMVLPAAKLLEIDFYPFTDKLPKLSNWMCEIEKIRGFEDAYPPHWRDE
ncbi:MAG TPA: glutathione S-transferase family protein [Gammaproteobacteria bacterium]|nr:glutathione S-transferase family protein [Gammaproteobacteria bacterium]